MTIREEVNRIYREFHRYTGDGLPNEPTGAPLPVGDPQSGVHSPKKAHLRDGFGIVGDIIDAAAVSTGENAQRAEDAADAAEASAASAAAIAGFDGTAATVGVSPSVADTTNVQAALEALEALAGTGSVYDTAADVAAATIGDDVTSLQTLGRVAIGDGGGSTYRRKEVIEADADGDLVSDNGVRFALETDHPTPQMFGFIPDGATTDMTPGIQMAVDYVKARNPEGGFVIMPPVRNASLHYRMVTGVNVPNGVHIRGNRFGTLIYYEGTGYAFTWGTSSSALNYGGGFDGFYLVLNNPDANGFYLRSTVGVTIREGRIEGWPADHSTKTNTCIAIDGTNISSFFNNIENIEASNILVFAEVFTTGTLHPTQQRFINCGINGSLAAGATGSIGYVFTGADVGSGTSIIGGYIENFAVGVRHGSGSGQITVVGTEFEIDASAICVQHLGSGNRSTYIGCARLRTINGAPGYVTTNGDIDIVGAFRFQNNKLLPHADGANDVGEPAFRIAEYHGVASAIVTSDEREKQDIESIPDEWLDAWGDVQHIRYKWRKAVEEKGEAARWHIGYIAQQIRDAFADRGLDAHEIGLLCFDEWTDDDGTARDRYGLRQAQCEVMEAAYQRRRMARIEARLAALEA
jgi:hypothetical protein